MGKLIKLPSRKGQIIYGPIHSRRIGVDIGINLLVQEGKTCNFDCLYCQYGRTGNLVKTGHEGYIWVSPTEVSCELEKALSSLSKSGYHLDAVTFSGYGEPTLHPEFSIIVKDAKIVKDRYYPEAKLTLITNSANLNTDKNLRALMLFDQIIAKLDAASNKAFHAINRPADSDLNIEKIIEDLTVISKKTNRLILQILIFDTSDIRLKSNNSLEEMKALSDAVCKIKPKSVQIYTLVRASDYEELRPVDSEKLNQLRKLIDAKCGGEVLVKIY